MKRTLASIEFFIKHEIKKKLRKDLEALRILKEADLQSCFYYHLRRFLNKDDNWRIYSEKHTPQGTFIDLIISEKYSRVHAKGYKPRIAIELKWHKKEISPKDRKSLRKAIRKLKVRKAYFVTTIYVDDKYQRTDKLPKEKYRLHEVAVRLGNRTDMEEWISKRERIRKVKDISKKKNK